MSYASIQDAEEEASLISYVDGTSRRDLPIFFQAHLLSASVFSLRTLLAPDWPLIRVNLLASSSRTPLTRITNVYYSMGYNRASRQANNPENYACPGNPF